MVGDLEMWRDFEFECGVLLILNFGVREFVGFLNLKFGVRAFLGNS